VNDLKAAGADAWMDVNDLGAGNFQQGISAALAKCEWFLLVLTRHALASEWVTMEVDAAIRLKHQGKVKELIFIKAAGVDYSELPPLWGVFNIFDATANYMAALNRTLNALRVVPQTIPEDTPPHMETPLHVAIRSGLSRANCPYCGVRNEITATGFADFYDVLFGKGKRAFDVQCVKCHKLFIAER
jgi:hypothetical protein